MKLAKLSLVAIVVAGLASSSFAESTTLADAFKNGKVTGELRAWYFDRDTGNANKATYAVSDVAKGNADLFSTGVMLSYVTDSLYGLSLGTTFQSNYAPFADKDAKNLYGTDMYGSGAVLSEAYVTYTLGKTTAKVGRQFIASPLVASSGSRMVKEAFQAAVLINTDLPNTTLVAGYSDKMQGRTSDYDRSVAGEDSEISSFKKEAVFYGTGTTAGSNVFGFDGAYTAAAINKSITNLTLTGQYLFVNDVEFTEGGDANVFYAEGNYVVPLSNMKLLLDATYRGSRTSNETFDGFHVEGNMYQGRVGFKELAGFNASFAYSTVATSDQSVLLGAGNGPTTYTAPLVKGAEVTSGANTDAYKLEVGYDFSKVGVPGLKVLGQYVKVNQDRATNTSGIVLNGATVDTESTFLEAQIAYDIPSLKGLTLSLEYEDGEKETTSTVNSNEMRFRANYKF